MSQARRVLVLCPGTWDKEGLRHDRVVNGHELLFHGEDLLETPPLLKALRFDVFGYIRQVVRRYAGERLMGVVGTGDYPGCMLAAAVAAELKLPGPSLESVVRLSHKFYSRELQRKAIPEAIPDYQPLNPFAPLERQQRLAFPFFIKPVKGTMSIRAQMVRSRPEYDAAVRFSLKERIGKYLLLRPFQHLVEACTDNRVPAHYFIGESPLSGEQVTVDGFVQDGRAVVMGVVDSVMYPGTMSFRRFEYPSRLPADVQRRMRELAIRLIEASGLDHSCFNIEMFYEAKTDAIHVIEVNPRMSYQFADLYERVDGTSTYAVQLALTTGTPVKWQPGGGKDRATASFVMRRFSDAKVLAVPTTEQLEQARRRFPGIVIKVLCSAGERLSDHDQDVGSFRYAIVNMGAPSAEELYADYAELERMLTFRFDR